MLSQFFVVSTMLVPLQSNKIVWLSISWMIAQCLWLYNLNADYAYAGEWLEYNVISIVPEYVILSFCKI